MDILIFGNIRYVPTCMERPQVVSEDFFGISPSTESGTTFPPLIVGFYISEST